MSGDEQSWQEKQLCLDNVRGVRGIRKVTDAIDVKILETRPDREIEAYIERYLSIDVRVDASDVEVEVQDDKVHLTSTVGSAAERTRARNDSWVRGVESVDVRDLHVVPDRMSEIRGSHPVVNLSDEEIADNIRSEITWSPFVDGDKVSVSVEDGVAILTGTASSWLERRKAEETAREGGAIHVRNRLEVKNARSFEDLTNDE